MLMLRFLGWLPLPILYLIGDILYLVNGVMSYRKKVVTRNLELAFPEKSVRERKQIARKFYKNLFEVIVETVKLRTLPRDQMEKRVRFKNLQIVDDNIKLNKSIVMLTAHQCNWEWALQGGNVQFPMVADGIYKPLKNKEMDKLLLEIRTKFGGELISKDTAVRNLLLRKGETRIIGIVGDQRPLASTPKTWKKLMGIDTAFYTGAEQIPKLLNAVVVFAWMRRKKRGYYEIELIKIGEPPYEKDSEVIIDEYVRLLQDMIMENPSDWLWSHNRWKYGKEIDQNVT